MLNYLSFEDFGKMFQSELSKINETMIENHKKYGKDEDFFSSFRLVSDLGFMTIWEVIYMRGILDKLKRIWNILKRNWEYSVQWEGLYESVYDIIGYAILLMNYAVAEKNNNYTFAFAEENTNKFMKHMENTIIAKNTDYSNSTGNKDNLSANAIENFVLIEKCGIASIENWILSRIAIKTQRIANHLKNKVDTKVIGEDIVDFVIYSIILLIVLKQKELEKNKEWEQIKDKKKE